MTTHAPDNTLNEYENLGAYHSELNLSRSWLPRYFRRLHVAENLLLEHAPKTSCIVDIGGGEGILVKRLVEFGFTNVTGVDPYAPFIYNKMVRGDIFSLPFADRSIDFAILLDVLEHIPLHLQDTAAQEIQRTLKPNGILLLSVPNMAHLSSRIAFLVHGKPWRNELQKHPGELAIKERLEVLERAGFELIDDAGLHLTLTHNPRPNGKLGKFLSKLMFYPKVPPGLCWTVMLLLGKKKANYSGLPERPLRRALSTYQPPEQDPTHS